MAQGWELFELWVEARVEERVEGLVVAKDDVLHVVPVAPVNAGVGVTAAWVEIDDPVLIGLAVPDDFCGGKAIANAVE